MANDAKLGLMSGIAVVLVVAVFFQSKPSAGTAFIQNDNASTAAPSPTSPVSTPTSHSIPEGNSPPPQAPAGVSTVDSGVRTIWQPSEPREVKPVSRDPLLWP